MPVAIVVDVETTGLNANEDQIIELGYCEFVWDATNPPRVLEMYSGLEDPLVAIPSEITKLTGIRDEDVRNRKINWDLFEKAWARSELVIAHNAEFDRGFLNKIDVVKRNPKPWACSVRHISWTEKGFGSRKLQYLAADSGFLNPFAHRALFDCATLVRVIAPYMSELSTRCFQPETKILATGSPFESKDILKSKGYRWDPEQRVWGKSCLEEQLQSEREFLAREVYKGNSRHTEEQIWFNPMVQSTSALNR